MALLDKNFVAGGVYFIVMYEDYDLCIPAIQTLIFVESTISATGRLKHFFRDISAGKDAQGFHVHEEQVDDLLLNWQGLMETLNSCFARVIHKNETGKAL